LISSRLVMLIARVHTRVWREQRANVIAATDGIMATKNGIAKYL
jgi:hypothetical protein